VQIGCRCTSGDLLNDFCQAACDFWFGHGVLFANIC
jgi:hypothetical protein